MTDITAKARGFIAGEVAASGGRAAADVSSGILARLQREGLAVVDASQAQAVSALAGLDAILDLRGAAGDEEIVREWAAQMGMESPDGLMAVLVAVAEVLAVEPPAPAFGAAALREAYRLGHDRGTYDAGGDPVAVDHQGDAFRFREAADLRAHVGETPVGEALDRLHAGQAAPVSAAA